MSKFPEDSNNRFNDPARESEPGPATASDSTEVDGGGRGGGETGTAGVPCGETGNRGLRARYLAVKNLINEERDDIGKADSDTFKTIFREVESLQRLVQNPREQIADAEALLDITNSLVTSVKEYSNGGITASVFVTCLLRDFGQQGGPSSMDGSRNSVHWKDIGVIVDNTFKSFPGCCTMIGPMNNELKHRKVAVRKHVKPPESAQPEVAEESGQKRAETDKNMGVMFDILKKKKCVKLENLVLNRNSFAQTVENLFALSFLVKDGRVEIKVNENGCHLLFPRNAPAASSVVSGKVAYRHFVFRFDFKDWQLMKSTVKVGEELMPERNQVNTLSNGQSDAGSTTPIRKLSRNRGLVFQEEAIAEDSSPESEITRATRVAIIRKGKRKVGENGVDVEHL